MPVTIRSIRSLKPVSMSFRLPSDGIKLNSGAFTVLIGQNGSGKTTLLEAVLGIRTDYEVDRTILDDSSSELMNSTKRRIGVSTQVHGFADGVTVADIIKLHAQSYKITRNDALLDTLDLSKVLDSKFVKISGGQKKRISIYFALAHEPEVCILDEPEAGLDSQGLDAFLAYIERRTQLGKTTLAASHHGKTTALADELHFLNDGEVSFAGSKTNFIDQFLGKRVLEIDVGNLSNSEQDYLFNFGKTRCFEGVGKDKMLVFGQQQDLSMSVENPEAGLDGRSILRDIRPSDILTWVNNRVA